VTLRGQQPQQAQGDLSVPTGHQDVHGWSLRVRARSARQQSSVGGLLAPPHKEFILGG
jgi:hypothetical protein